MRISILLSTFLLALLASSAGAGGRSAPVTVDLRKNLECMTGEPQTLVYSAAWVTNEPNATVEIRVNGALVFSGAGSGTVSWTPERSGSYALTHSVLVDEDPVGEPLPSVIKARGKYGMVFFMY